MKFTIRINAPKEIVWSVLWQDDTFREWAGLIDPGTYMKGELKEGAEVEFISTENGYGVTSLVKELIPNEYLLLQHAADTQDAGARDRANEWTGGKEMYRLVESNNITVLTAEFDVPKEMEEYFATNYPKALNRVKELAEKV